MRPHQPVGKAVAVADGIAEREARRLAGRLQLLAEVEQARVVVRHLLVASGRNQRLAIDQRAAARAERQPDPDIALVAPAVFCGEELPAAVTLAEIVGDVGKLDQLVDIDVRRFREADDDIGACAGIRRYRGLLVDVLPADEIDLDLHAGLVGEALGVGAEHLLVGLHEAHRPQHAQAGALFDRKRRRGDVGGLDRRFGIGRCAGGGEHGSGQAQGQRVTACDLVRHGFSP